LTPDGKTLVMSHFDLLAINDAIREDDPTLGLARFAIIDVDRMERRAMIDVCAGGHGIAVSPDSTRAFVSCLGDELAIIDLVSSDHPVSRVPVIDTPGSIAAPNCYPYAITAAPAGDVVFVSCFQTGQVRAFDTASGVIDAERSFQLVGGAMFGTFSADGSLLFIPHQDADGVTIVDGATGDIERILPLGLDGCVKPHGVRLTEDEERLMLVCEGDHGGPGSFVVVNVASGVVEHTVELGVFPDDIAIVRRQQ
jgi:DNA-binding beta-propeller fold protein YncE